MKHLLLLVLTIVLFAACNKEEEKGFKFRSDESIIIHEVNQVYVAMGNRVRLNTEKKHTLHDIVRSETTIMWLKSNDDDTWWMRHLSQAEKDTINDVIRLPAYFILSIDEFGVPIFVVRDLIDCPQIFFTTGGRPQFADVSADTVGYIPQSVIASVRQKIDSLYAAEDYEGMVEVFHNDFIFHPCTGAEYRQIVAEGAY